MRLFGHSVIKFYRPRFTKTKEGQGWFFKFTPGPAVSDPACVFWNHLAVWLKINRLFLGGFELMWG